MEKKLNHQAPMTLGLRYHNKPKIKPSSTDFFLTLYVQKRSSFLCVMFLG